MTRCLERESISDLQCLQHVEDHIIAMNTYGLMLKHTCAIKEFDWYTGDGYDKYLAADDA